MSGKLGRPAGYPVDRALVDAYVRRAGTAKALAAELGPKAPFVTPSFLSNIRAGKNLSAQRAVDFALALGVDPRRLVPTAPSDWFGGGGVDALEAEAIRNHAEAGTYMQAFAHAANHRPADPVRKRSFLDLVRSAA